MLEEVKFTKSLYQCADFLGQSGISGPYRWVAGMEGVRGRYLQEDIFRRKMGACLVDLVEVEGIYKPGENVLAALEPFFEEVFDKCGLPRLSNVT